MTSNISFPSPHFIVFLALLFCASYTYCRTTSLDESDVHGYHFHVYFYPGAPRSSQDAIVFRDAIQNQISSGHLADCIVKPVNMGPYGPHMVGNYETCCNKTSIPQALSFFMLNHGNLSVLVHPLTRYERMDHSGREMFLGPRIPMDTSVIYKTILTCVLRQNNSLHFHLAIQIQAIHLERQHLNARCLNKYEEVYFYATR